MGSGGKGIDAYPIHEGEENAAERGAMSNPDAKEPWRCVSWGRTFLVVSFFPMAFLLICSCDKSGGLSADEYCAELATRWGELLRCPGVEDFWPTEEETKESCRNQVNCWKDLVTEDCLRARLDYDMCLVAGGCDIEHCLSMPECSESNVARWDECTDEEVDIMFDCQFLYCFYTAPEYSIPPSW
jgi:hypothetical protein